MIDSENFQTGDRFQSVNAESSDGEEGESQPESQSSSNTRDQIYRLHHVILLKHLSISICYTYMLSYYIFHDDSATELYGDQTGILPPGAAGHQAGLLWRQGTERLSLETIGEVVR